MIDREMLRDIGFIIGTGWDHEVWVYDGIFWVHYGGSFVGIEGAEVDGNTTDRHTFFKMFVDQIIKETREAMMDCED